MDNTQKIKDILESLRAIDSTAIRMVDNKHRYIDTYLTSPPKLPPNSGYKVTRLGRGHPIMLYIDDLKGGGCRVQCSECGGETDIAFGTMQDSKVPCKWCSVLLNYPAGASW